MKTLLSPLPLWLAVASLVYPLTAQSVSELELEKSSTLGVWESVTITPEMISGSGKLLVPTSGSQQFYRMKVRLLESPTISNPPPATTGIEEGESVTFTVDSQGEGLTYQWYLGQSGDDSQAIQDATSQTYNTGALAADTSYWVKVTNVAGSINSETVAVTINRPPTIASQPTSQTIEPSSTATLTVSVTGSAPFTYQWYRGNLGATTAPVGTNSPTFTTPALSAATKYWVKITNALGEIQSSSVTISVRLVMPKGMTNLGVLPGYFSSIARKVSTNGSVVVVGECYDNSNTRAFRWTQAGGMSDIGVLPGGSGSSANGVSADGSVVVGNSSSSSGDRAFRWTQGGGLSNIGVLQGGYSSFASDVSADGSVVVGECYFSSSSRAFRWTQAGGMSDIGVLPGGSGSSAFGVSADGSVVVGYSSSSSGDRAFRWTQAGGMSNIGVLPGGSRSYASAVSADGSVVVGWGDSSSGARAFRWTQGGGMSDIGVLPSGSESYAFGVSTDGSVVVGRSSTSSGDRAFRWTQGGGMVDLGVLQDFTTAEANDVSNDGSIAVGFSGAAYSNSRAFLWNAP